MLKAIYHHACPRRAQLYRRPPPRHPVGEIRVGPGWSAEQHQQGTSQCRQHAIDELDQAVRDIRDIIFDCSGAVPGPDAKKRG